MTLKEFYEKVGGDYSEVMDRLVTEERIEKYMFRFLEIKDFENLKTAMKEKNWPNAFLAAHTLKGNSLNLGFGNFTKADSALTEYLRPLTIEDENKLNELYEQTVEQFNLLIATINEYKNA